MFGRNKKPPVISEPKPFPASPARDEGFARGRETNFSVDRGPVARRPWLATGLLLGATAALFGASMKYDYLLGQIVVPICGLMSLHGLFRGGFRKAIMLPVTVVVVGFLATNPTVFDPIVQRVMGGPSEMGNIVACALAASLVLWLVGWPVKAIRNRVIMKRPVLRGTDRFFGTGIGLAEGAFTSLLILWATVLLEPHARQVTTHPNANDCQKQFAGYLVRLANDVDASPIAPIVRDSNLLEEIPAVKEQIRRIESGECPGKSCGGAGGVKMLIDALENMNDADAKKAAESLRELERNNQSRTDAYRSLPQPTRGI